MQVTITYNDDQSFTKEEIVRTAVHNYGKAIEVKVMPDSTNAHDLIYFGIQQMVTHEQLSLVYDKTASYQSDLKKLRAEALYKLQEILDAVLVDNEAKVA
jgi:hypothetical protein